MIIGITGSYGTGKTTVAREFAKRGAAVIDADKLVHSFIRPAVRKKLSKIVFKKKAYLQLICRVIHPLVIKKIKDRIKKLSLKKKIIVIDAPLLIECGLEKLVDKLIVVKASRQIQLRRLKEKTGFSQAQILRRINFQIPLRKKLKLADFIIDNDGKLTYTRVQVGEVWRKIINNSLVKGGKRWKS